NLPALSAVLRYEYDELGNLTQTIRPDGQVQANLSYGSGHIYGIAFNQQDMVAFQRDDLHRETTRLLANGLVQNKNYNDVGLLSSQIIRHEQETLDQLQQAKHQAERHYHYDNNYLLTQVDDSRLGKLSYQYDPIGRLIKAQNPYSSESFSFDPAGNLIDPIATQTSQVKNNLISQYQGKHYKYDAQGNVIETSQSGQTLKLTWDNLNRLIQSDHNGQITSYGYDVFGRRLFKKNTTEDSLTLFGWDGDLMIWESYKTNSNQLNKQNYTKHYVYEPDSFVPLLQTGYTRFIELIETPDYRQFQDVPYSIYKDPVWKTDTQKNKAELERVAFYHCDQVGTPQTLSNELGECIWEIKQDTWGTTQEIKTANESNPLEQSNLRFQGQYYDKETGLHYNRYRYYEPYSARYVSKDPIGLNGGLHQLAYVNNPLQWIDALGLNGEPTLPNSKIVQQSGITIEHYYYGNDHLPAHAHVNGGGKTVKIGANGKPLKGEPALSSKQQQVVNENLSVIRRDINKINKYLKFQNYGCTACKPNSTSAKSTGTTLKAVGIMSFVQSAVHIFTIPQCKDSSLSSKCLCAMEAETLGVSYEQYCDPYGLETIY
ncbi:RHS repeat-associated core domain-containing protein, partial [Acinetobacter bereziniae]